MVVDRREECVRSGELVERRRAPVLGQLAQGQQEAGGRLVVAQSRPGGLQGPRGRRVPRLAPQADREVGLREREPQPHRLRRDPQPLEAASRLLEQPQRLTDLPQLTVRLRGIATALGGEDRVVGALEDLDGAREGGQRLPRAPQRQQLHARVGQRERRLLVPSERGVLVSSTSVGLERGGVPSHQPVGDPQVLDGVRAQVARLRLHAAAFLGAGHELAQCRHELLADLDGLLVPTQVVEHVHAAEVRAQRSEDVAVLGPQGPRVGDEPQCLVQLTALGQHLRSHVPGPGLLAVQDGAALDPQRQPLGPARVPVHELGRAVQRRGQETGGVGVDRCWHVPERTRDRGRPGRDALLSSGVARHDRSPAQPPWTPVGTPASRWIKLLVRDHRAHADTSAGRRETAFSSAFRAGSVGGDGRESPLSQAVSVAAVGDTIPPVSPTAAGGSSTLGTRQPLTPCDPRHRLTRVN